MKDLNCIMIYDGECPYCKLASVTVDKIEEDINIIEWQNKASQQFLNHHFEDPPFGLIFIDPSEEKIWLGSDAVSKISSKTKDKNKIGNIISQNYNFIADTVSFLNNRDREIDRYKGTHNLKNDSENLIRELIDESDRFL